jgi:hypothetical protein
MKMSIFSNDNPGRIYQRAYAGICRVRSRIGNSSSQKKFALYFSTYIFFIFIKYEKSRDENGLETESGGSSPPGGAGPLLAAPSYGESTLELISVPVSSCDFVSMFNFCLYNPPDCLRSVYRVLVVFSFRSVSIWRLFSVLEASWLPQATTRRRHLQKMITKTLS